MGKDASAYSRKEMCELLGVSRSGLYDQTHKESGARRRQDESLGEKIERIFMESPCTYGRRRIARMLRREGVGCGKERISRLMEERQLEAVQKRRGRPKTTQSRHDQPIAVNRLKELAQPPGQPNEIWCGDITYIPSQQDGWLYLAGELDLCSKRLAGWKLGYSLEAELVIEAFGRAVKLWNVAPEIHHSDRGVQYASKDFRRVLDLHEVSASMSRKACCYDNASMESFWATLKTECFQNQVPLNRAHAQALLFDYIETFYNPKRLHSTLGYRSPLEFERSFDKPSQKAP
jgi:putative transposase